MYVRDILEVSQQELWFATESGIYILNRGTAKFLNLKKKFLDPYSLSDNAVYTVYKDQEGGIWAGTYFGGLNYFPKQYFTFQKFFPDYSEELDQRKRCSGNLQDQYGNLWIGTEDAGLSKLNPITKKVIRFEPTGVATSISNSNIHGLLIIENDLWIGTFERGLDIMDIQTGKVKKHYTAGSGPYQLKSNFIVSMLHTKKGDIYAGTSNGLFRYNSPQDNFLPVKEIPEGGFISCLIEDKEGTVWVGTHGRALFILIPSTGKKAILKMNPITKTVLLPISSMRFTRIAIIIYGLLPKAEVYANWIKTKNNLHGIQQPKGLPVILFLK